MSKKILVALAAIVPLFAFAQGAGPGPGPGPRGGTGPGQWNPEFAAKRMRLARTLGLAEALDLDAAQALKLNDALAKSDQQRLALFQQMRDSHQVLRRAATGEKVSAAEVDQAIGKALEARAQLQALDKQTVQTVTQGLSPEKKARAVLFLARFQHRMRGGGGMGMGPGGPGPGRMGRHQMMHGGGMGPGMGMGPGGPGPGAMADGECPNCPMHDDYDD